MGKSPCMIDEALSAPKVVRRVRRGRSSKRDIIISLHPSFDASLPLRCDYGAMVLRIGAQKRAIPYFRMQVDRRRIVLSRIELGGTHQNPSNGPKEPWEWLVPFRAKRFVNEPHLHLWAEGLRDGWAVPLARTDFEHFDGPSIQLIEAYLEYCSISGYASIEWALW